MPDTFRSQYRELSPEEKERLVQIKSVAEHLQMLLTSEFNRGSIHNASHNGAGAREMAIARTKLEEVVMWATKGVTA